MKLMHSISALTLGLLLSLSGCNPDNAGQGPDPVDQVAEPTEVGTPQGAVVSKHIGPQGGTLATADGQVELTIPAGALTQETTISIQPISNHTPNGVGTSYRFLPDGQQFSKPATLKFRYSDAEVVNSAPEALGIAYQRTDKVWYNVPGKSLDKQKREVTVPMPHFSDWSLFENFMLVTDPAKDVLKYGESVTLQIMELAPLTETKEEPLIQRTGGANNGLKWSLVGGGTLKPSGSSATYTAPRGPSNPNPVTISVELNFKNNPTKLILVKELYIGSGFVKVNFLGKDYVFSSMAILDDEDPTNASIIGATPKEVLQIEFSNGRKGSFPFWYTAEGNKCRVSFTLSPSQQYDSGHDWCDGEDMVASGQVVFEEYVPGKYVKGTFSGNLIKYDHQCTKAGPAISGSFFVMSATALIPGI
ncbi:hypothetical protein [Telluribacter sp. SYSU D00476]|uniref:hypothetical protein n=1 Tax=Telluribacter sp. SYSU D00476 TaxID=2811430 RepID=UPI001FF2C602|nr:hypothetical protein [Telluribacter sp. SYSU D00476]